VSTRRAACKPPRAVSAATVRVRGCAPNENAMPQKDARRNGRRPPNGSTSRALPWKCSTGGCCRCGRLPSRRT
jgi:hypothetical protein